MSWNVSRIPKIIPIWRIIEFEDDRKCLEWFLESLKQNDPGFV